MPVLADTNVLLRAIQPSHAMHTIAVRAIEALIKQGEVVVVTFQNIAEFWNAATRPAINNGLGFSIEEAQQELGRIESIFQILSESSESYDLWKSLLTANRISGVQVHDARLVAVMKANGISRIVTFDVSDFARFTEIEAVHPGEIS